MFYAARLNWILLNLQLIVVKAIESFNCNLNIIILDCSQRRLVFRQQSASVHDAAFLCWRYCHRGNAILLRLLYRGRRTQQTSLCRQSTGLLLVRNGHVCGTPRIFGERMALFSPCCIVTQRSLFTVLEVNLILYCKSHIWNCNHFV